MPYFHVVFTVPEELNLLAPANPKWFYDLLFESASKTLLEIAADPKHLGARIGVLAVLHTWSQTLLLHPHVHCIVPGGGLSLDGQSWVGSRPGFFLPIRVLARLFRGKFLAGIKTAWQKGEVSLPETLQDTFAFQDLLDRLYKCLGWSTASPPSAARSRYSPIWPATPTGWRFPTLASSGWKMIRSPSTYKDYVRGGQVREMTLSAEEFIRRLLLHVLPDGFVRIRYYGLLPTAIARSTWSLRRSRGPSPRPASIGKLGWPGSRARTRRCPQCGRGHLRRVEELAAVRFAGSQGRSPP